jgi:hypothetical protein
MIATRLHAKRHSSATSNRLSIVSVHGLPHPYVPRHKASKRPSEIVPNIDSDEHESNGRDGNVGDDYQDDTDHQRKLSIEDSQVDMYERTSLCLDPY